MSLLHVPPRLFYTQDDLNGLPGAGVPTNDAGAAGQQGAANQDPGAGPGTAQNAPAAPPAQEPGGDVQLTEAQQAAFAKRLAAATEKVRQDALAAHEPELQLAAKLRERGIDPRVALIEMERTGQLPGLAPQAPQSDPVAALSEQTGLAPEAAQLLLGLYQQNQTLAQQQARIADDAEASQLKAADATFDRAAAEKARTDFQARYGTRLSLADAWRFAPREQQIQAATQAAEQRALAQIAAGQRGGTAPPAGGTGKPSIADMSDADFEALEHAVRSGVRRLT